MTIGSVVNAAETPIATDATPTDVITVDTRPGDNMRITDVLSPFRVICALISPIHNMWSGRFHHLRTDQPTMIGWNMEGQDGGMNAGNVTKWVNLKPVVCEGDDNTWDAYQFWTKNANGVWECTSDPFRKGPDRFAGNGKVPNQSAIPAEIANAYLDSSGEYFQCWREADSEVVPALNTFRTICQFKAETASVAMRIPMSYSFSQQIVKRIDQYQPPRVYVDWIGSTAGGRKIQVVRVEDPDGPAANKDGMTVLLIAKEHATEHSSAWPLYGIFNSLLSENAVAKQLRKGTTWLLIFMEDPDGSDDVVFDRLTDKFCNANDPNVPTEVFTYTRYLSDYINSGRTIDMAISVHNTEANETPHAFVPFLDLRHLEDEVKFNTTFFKALSEHGYTVGQPDKPWDTGWMNNRLYSWCTKCYNSMGLAWEVNDRFPQRSLSLQELEGIGQILGIQLSAWLSSPNGDALHTSLKKALEKRDKDRIQYFQQVGRDPMQRTNTEILSLGY